MAHMTACSYLFYCCVNAGDIYLPYIHSKFHDAKLGDLDPAFLALHQQMGSGIAIVGHDDGQYTLAMTEDAIVSDAS